LTSCPSQQGRIVLPRLTINLTFVRDSWESSKASIETKISQLLGEKYTCEVNMNAIFAYADSGYAKDTPGKMVKEYFDGFITKLEPYLQQYGDDGKSTFNSMVSSKVVTFEVDPTAEFWYGGCDIKEGKFRILTKDSYLGSYCGDACAEILKAVETAEAASGAGGLSVGAKTNIKETVDKQLPDLEKKFSDIIGAPLKLDANLLGNYTKLLGTSFKDSEIGTATVEYFSTFANNLESLNFKADDMMQEGFQDACAAGTIRLEVVDTLQHGWYNDVIFEDGICKIQVYFPRLRS
jgi:hypothetical protein